MKEIIAILMMNIYRRINLNLIIFMSTLIIVIIIDQLIKYLISEYVIQPPNYVYVLPILNLILSYNTGVSFSLLSVQFADYPIVLGGAQFIIVLCLSILALSHRGQLELVSYGLIIGGALGNIIDRFRVGAVIDFIDVHIGGWHWPTFNVADIAVCSGAFLLIWSAYSYKNLGAMDNRNV